MAPLCVRGYSQHHTVVIGSVHVPQQRTAPGQVVTVTETVGSFILAVVGLTGLSIAAHRPRVGWWFNIAAQVAWVTFGAVTHQYGFIVMSAGYTVAYIRLLRRAYTHTPPQVCTHRHIEDTEPHLTQTA